MLYLCFLFDLHHPTDDPVTDGATCSFGLSSGVFLPSYDMQYCLSLIPAIHGKGLSLPEVIPRDLAC